MADLPESREQAAEGFYTVPFWEGERKKQDFHILSRHYYSLTHFNARLCLQ